MRSKLALGGLAVAVAFLLATNPTVVDAAGQITSKQIKNETIKSKDVKDGELTGADVKDGALAGADLADGAVGSAKITDNGVTTTDVANGTLTAGDLAPGTLPAPEITQFERYSSSGVTALGALAFVGQTATVTVDGDDIVTSDMSLLVFGGTTGDDFNYGICQRPVGSGATPTPLGGSAGFFVDVDVLSGDNSNSMTAADVLPAGSYTIGACAALSTGSVSYERVNGTVTVLSGSTGALARSVAGSAERPAGAE